MWVVIDSLNKKYTEPTMQLDGEGILVPPFPSASPSDICTALRDLCWQGSDINYTQFIILDVETPGKDWVRLCHSSDAEKGKEEVEVEIVKVGLEVLDTTMFALSVCHPGMNEIVEHADGCEEGVYDRKKKM